MTTTRIPVHPQIKQAQEMLARESTPEVQFVVAMLLDTGMARWALDPHVDNVVGLLDTSTDNTAWLIVYLDDTDFEVSDTFDDLMLAVPPQT